MLYRKSNFTTVRYEENTTDEFARLFSIWSDVEYVEEYFEKHKEVYFQSDFKNIPIENAIFEVIEEAQYFESQLLKQSPDSIFKFLHKQVLTKDFNEFKAYGKARKSFLRIYAVQIEDIYVILGGGIKFCKSMQDIPELENELLKLKAVKNYLKTHFSCDDDFIELEFNFSNYVR